MFMFEGVFCPSVTILDDKGEIDFEAWGAHLDHLADSGLNGILVFGSIGEFYAFSAEEKRRAIEFAVDRVAGRTKVLAGIGSTRVDEVVELAKWCRTCGVDGLVVVSPYYFGPSTEAAERYFSLVSEATDLPVVLYNFPARTGSDLSPQLVADLAAKHPTIVGIKDTVDTISHTRQVVKAVRAVREDFSVLSGFDEYYLPNRIAGGQGVLCGLTNVVPELFVEMNAAYSSGDTAHSIECARKISDLMAVYNEGDLFIGAIKEAVKQRGLKMSTRCREPEVPVTSEQASSIAALLS